MHMVAAGLCYKKPVLAPETWSILAALGCIRGLENTLSLYGLHFWRGRRFGLQAGICWLKTLTNVNGLRSRVSLLWLHMHLGSVLESVL